MLSPIVLISPHQVTKEQKPDEANHTFSRLGRCDRSQDQLTFTAELRTLLAGLPNSGCVYAATA